MIKKLALSMLLVLSVSAAEARIVNMLECVSKDSKILLPLGTGDAKYTRDGIETVFSYWQMLGCSSNCGSLTGEAGWIRYGEIKAGPWPVSPNVGALFIRYESDAKDSKRVEMFNDNETQAVEILDCVKKPVDLL
ncbi:MAG: hypothetical protein WC635_07505 [Bacteriovorax sp.]|jgi:hypothetical protein